MKRGKEEIVTALSSEEGDDNSEAAEAATNLTVLDPATKPQHESTTTTTTIYKSRKPLWWKQLARSRPTKSQKKAIRAMQSSHQLPRLAYGAYYDWKAVFSSKNCHNEVWVEIGCGTGENILALAEYHPNKCFIGAEMHSTGIGNCFQHIYQATRRQRYWKDYMLYSLEQEEQEQCTTTPITEDGKGDQPVNYNDESLYGSDLSSPEGPYPNLNIFCGNGVKVVAASPPGSLDVVLITFPDPFDKQPSHRLLQSDVLAEISRALRPNGGRLVVATDHDGYAAWAAQQVERRNYHQSQEVSFWKKIHVTTELRTLYLPIVSKYEAKGWREGRTTKVLLYERV